MTFEVIAAKKWKARLPVMQYEDVDYTKCRVANLTQLKRPPSMELLLILIYVCMSNEGAKIELVRLTISLQNYEIFNGRLN